MRNRKGFTLIELLIVIIIVGILAAVSIPMMTANVDSARATEAVAALGAIRTQMRIHRATNPSYATGMPGAVPFNVVGNVDGFNAGSLDGNYFDDNDYTIEAIGQDNFTAQADVVAGGAAPNQAEVAGLAPITINEQGVLGGLP
jgi:prepilin-type N-terminal cleavage/methylation domain-containing protein